MAELLLPWLQSIPDLLKECEDVSTVSLVLCSLVGCVECVGGVEVVGELEKIVTAIFGESTPPHTLTNLCTHTHIRTHTHTHTHTCTHTHTHRSHKHSPTTTTQCTTTVCGTSLADPSPAFLPKQRSGINRTGNTAWNTGL